MAELLEPRVLLSIAAVGTSMTSQQVTQLAKAHYSQLLFQAPASSSKTISPLNTSPVGLIPSQLRGAYGLGQVGSSSITFGSVQGDGTGQTIAIIDAFDDPNALSDLQHFDAQFGLPDPPSFQKFNESGQPSPLPAAAALLTSGVEISLDIEWAHVMAPGANIDLIECNSRNDFDLLEEGAQSAAQLPGVSVVSMSFSGPDFAGQNGLDSFFTGGPGVTFLAATGDFGSPGGYPADSQNVVGVGGTSLTVSGNTYVSETGWSGSGGGISEDEFQPSFQAPYFTSTQRTIPDLSMDADPSTGVAIYDSYDFPTSPWQQYGGTSLATPMMAGLMAIVNQGRTFNGHATLDGAGQTLPLLYSLPGSDFNDIVSGSNGGFSAGPGYDLVTGRGSPIANLLVPALASATAPALLPDLQPLQQGGWSSPILFSTSASVDTDPTMITPGQEVYLDATWFNDGATSESTPFLTNFEFGGGELGSVTTTPPMPNGLLPGEGEAISGAALGTIGSGIGALTYTIDSGNAVTESTETNNTYTRTYVIDNTANDNFVLQLNAGGTTVEILKNNTVVYSASQPSVNGFLFYLSGANDTLTVNASNGNPIPYGQVVADGSGSSNTMTVDGTSGNNALTINQSQLTLNGQTINYSGLGSITINTGSGNDTLTQLAQPSAALIFNPGGGSNTLNVDGGTFTFPAAVSSVTQQIFAVLSIASGAAAVLAPSTSPNLTLLQLNSLSNSGLLDLNNNDMIVHGGVLSNIFSQLQSGFNAGLGYWNGSTGIVSSSAAEDTRFLTTLGYSNGGIIFDGMSTSSSDVLVKYTYYGDADLNGLVNGADYQQIDAGYGTHGTGWAEGDFNYNGVVDGSDFGLIDNAFNQLFALGLSTTPLALLAARTSSTTGLATNAIPISSPWVASESGNSTPQALISSSFSPIPIVTDDGHESVADLIDDANRRHGHHF